MVLLKPTTVLHSRKQAMLLLGIALSALSPTYVQAETFDLETATIEKIHKAFASGSLTAQKLTELYLARIEAYDQKGPAINCIVTVNPDALNDALKLDFAYALNGPVGPLHGIPILVKDEVDTAGMPTTLGVPMFKDYSPPLDAFAVERLKKAGAIILAKTTLSEFAGGDTYSSLTGNSRNPYALDRTVGGSSGGSGGGLAAWFGTLAIGEETSSSLKRPAAWGCLAGMRPTPGLISRSGMWDGHPIPTAQMGPMALNVTDLALMLDSMVGYDPEDPITAMGVMHTPTTYTAFLEADSLKGARIGVFTQHLSTSARPDSEGFKKVDALFQQALEDLRKAGATLVDIEIPGLYDLLSKRSRDSAKTAEALHVYLSRNPNSQFKNQEDINNHPEMPNTFKAKVGRETGRWTSNPASAEAILESNYARETLLQLIAAAMAEHKLEAMAYKAVEHQPTLIEVATNPPYSSNGGVVSINTFLIHTPTITVPMGLTTDGIPAGFALLGLPFSDANLIRLAYGYEQATKHRVSPSTTPPLKGESFSF
jgi:amidase